MLEVTIRSTENGPNLVVIEGKVMKAYCRCGGSGNKPFCDGTPARSKDPLTRPLPGDVTHL